MICPFCGIDRSEADTRYRVNGRRKHLPPRLDRCRQCTAARALTRPNEWRERERRIRAQRQGKAYDPARAAGAWWRVLGRGLGRAVNLKAHGWRAETRAEWWIHRLRRDAPELYDPSLAERTLIFRARYALDPGFRRRQILRVHARKTEQQGGSLVDDGSLTPDVVRRLFAHAKACGYCDEPMASSDKSLDHIWPRSRGGIHSLANVVVCCKRCNTRKRAKTPDEWLEALANTHPLSAARLRQSWEPLIGRCA